MRNRLSLLLCTVVVLSAACSQGKPNFSGTWVESAVPPGVPPNPDLETTLTIHQDANTLVSTIVVSSKSRPSEKLMNPIKSTYQLDGVERKNSDGSSSKMYWDGNKLVLVTTRSRPEGGMSTFQNVWSLDGEGNLVMERTLSTPGSKPAALKSVLKKIR